MRNRHLFGLAVLAALALSACTALPPAQQPSAPNPIEVRAQQAVERGDTRTAIQLYRQLADAASGNARAGYMIEAARIAVAAGDSAAAGDWLIEAEADANAEQHGRIIVLRADIDVRESRAANAIARLNQLPESTGIRTMTDAEGVRGRALFQLGRADEAVRVLVERETWLNTADEILENQQLLWEGLSTPAASAVRPTGDELIDGWLALAPVAASGVADAELRGALIDWRREYVDHPAASVLLADLLAIERAAGAYPGQIALLLPISSAQRTAAENIRDGFLLAHLAAQSERDSADQISIRVYDTALSSAEDAYRRAQLEGAEFIVGPLLQPEVESIIEHAGFVPTLALNFVDADTALIADFWQFALAPEDETRAIARRAFADGARTAVALVSADEQRWGYRLLDSFRQELEALGGELLSYMGFSPTASDFSAQIETLLNLHRSEARHQDIQGALGIELAFQPRHRQDVDMIFIAAPNAGVARRLAPALRSHLAGDTRTEIPTYATSNIYEPSETAAEGDLNQIFFPDAPWLLRPDADGTQLRQTLQSYWPERTAAGFNLRLYGMGADAYRLVGALFGGGQRWPVQGLSGALELEPTGRVHRMLPFAQFRSGRPVPLEPAVNTTADAVAGPLPDRAPDSPVASAPVTENLRVQ